MDQLTLHEDPCSGNCYKIRLTAALLGLPLMRESYDILKGETRTPEFLSAVNAHGRIPVLQVKDRFLPESNAACFYLADGSPFIPQTRFERAEMLRWMFFEQYSHEPNIATSRFWLHVVGKGNLSDDQRALLPAKQAAGNDAFDLMESHLADRDWFAGDAVSLADIVLFPYSSVSQEGGFSLATRPNLCGWIDRVSSLPNFSPWDGAGAG